jgi:uncharacterized protein (TIGR01777 family)
MEKAMRRVLITGGTGLVGSRLCRLLTERGYGIHILSRSRSGQEGQIRYFRWSVKEGTIEDGALDVQHIIHLAGAGVEDKRWTTARKKEIRDSRVLSTRLLAEKIASKPAGTDSIVCASAVGYYGSRGSEILHEDAEPGSGFLSDICRQWEDASISLAEASNSPVSIMRIGIVLSALGGALPKLAGPAKFGIGAYLGDGSQYYPWIHIDDLCRMIIYAMENRLEGIYNASAPDPETNKHLTKIIAHVLKRPFIPAPAPAFVLKAAMGEMAAMVLNSQRTSARKIMDTGFEFDFPDLEKALQDIFRRQV